MAVDGQALDRAAAIGRRFADAEVSPWSAGLSVPPTWAVQGEVDKIVPGKPAASEPLDLQSLPRLYADASSFASIFKWTFLIGFALVAFPILLGSLVAAQPIGIAAGAVLSTLSAWLIRRARRQSRSKPAVRAEWDRWRRETNVERTALTQAILVAYSQRLAERRKTE